MHPSSLGFSFLILTLTKFQATPPTPSFEVCHANLAPWSYQSRKSGRGWGGALEAKGPGTSGGLQGAAPPPAPLLVSYLNTESHS